MRRRKKRKWKKRESLKIWKFIFREVVASRLFFPHFFDWWSWRSSFAWIFVTNMAGGKHHSWRRGYWKYWFVWPVIWVNFDFTTLMHVTLTQGPSSFIQSILYGSHCVSSHCGPIFSLWQFQRTPELVRKGWNLNFSPLKPSQPLITPRHTNHSLQTFQISFQEPDFRTMSSTAPSRIWRSAAPCD